jgi:hypothetical protein
MPAAAGGAIRTIDSAVNHSAQHAGRFGQELWN